MPGSGAAFNSITPALCLNKGSAIAADLIGAGGEDVERGEVEEGERCWRKGVRAEQELEMWAVAEARL